MASSLSLSAYLAWARRAGQAGPAPERIRPRGALIWGHATSLEHANALVQLAERLAHVRPGLHMLLTRGDDVAPPTHQRACVIQADLPHDTVPDAEAFLAHWAPDIGLWTGGDLRPALLSCADKQEIPLFLLDAHEARLSRTSWRWFPDLPKSLLGMFSLILARSERDARLLMRLGVKEEDIAVAGVFREGAIVLPCNAAERDELADLLRGRPIWLAAMVQPGELGIVLDAHRAVARVTHRIFLILAPDDETRADQFRSALDAAGMRYCTWSQGQMPEETTQVLLADTRGDMGLWYRLATITLMGSSLEPGNAGRDPNEPAAHGSAIVYGPNVRRYLSSYKRYAEAGAARIVRDSDTLAAALGQLIAPDQSAVMAHAAWDVASAGAGVTDRILDLIQDTLDVLEAG